MFKSLLTAAATASVAIAGFSSGAEARTSYCYTTGGGSNTVCILSVRRHNTLPKRLVRYNVNGGDIRTTEVTCYAQHAGNYKENLAGIACFEFRF